MADDVEVHDFTTKRLEGEVAEEILAQFMRKYGEVEITRNRQLQQLGIDAIMKTKRYGQHTLQFKACRRLKDTGNLYIELYTRNLATNKRRMGWAYVTTANHIVYWAVGTGNVYLLDATKLKRRLETWAHQYPVRVAHSADQGERWDAQGICVPISVVESEVTVARLSIVEKDLPGAV